VLAATALTGAVVIAEAVDRSRGVADDQRDGGSPPRSGLVIGLLIVALLAFAGASWKVYEVGHSGARAAWDDVTAPPF
jgi:hypothetical protein